MPRAFNLKRNKAQSGEARRTISEMLPKAQL